MREESMKQIYRDYTFVFEAVKNLYEKNKPLIIAIDGRCGSGKSSLAALLAEKVDCNVFHMDEFFLPFDIKTEARLAEPGGNVHYERFEAEVLRGLKKCQSVKYRPYVCSKGGFGEPFCVKYKNLNIVEGSYSMHPALQQAYAYKIFLTLDSKVQVERIKRRNGEVQLKNFLSKWIPMEEQYFSILNIKEQCDLIIDTTNMWN